MLAFLTWLILLVGISVTAVLGLVWAAVTLPARLFRGPRAFSSS
jgi:hypothetical protein